MTSTLGKFGPAAIGQEQYEQEQAVLKELGGSADATKYGPAAIGQEQADKVRALTEGKSTASFMKVGEVAEILASAPERVDEFLGPEMSRPGGPRKGVLKALLEAEEIRIGGARDDVIEQIQAALE